MAEKRHNRLSKWDGCWGALHSKLRELPTRKRFTHRNGFRAKQGEWPLRCRCELGSRFIRAFHRMKMQRQLASTIVGLLQPGDDLSIHVRIASPNPTRWLHCGQDMLAEHLAETGGVMVYGSLPLLTVLNGLQHEKSLPRLVQLVSVTPPTPMKALGRDNGYRE